MTSCLRRHRAGGCDPLRAANTRSTPATPTIKFWSRVATYAIIAALGSKDTYNGMHSTVGRGELNAVIQ
jgi:hypothetical protein